MKTVPFATATLLAFHSFAASSLQLRDWKSDSSFHPLDEAAQRVHVRQTEEAKPSARLIRIQLENCTSDDRALTLRHTESLPAGSLVWFDSPRTRRDLASERTLQSTDKTAPCGAGKYSWWPLVAVSAGACGRALAVDPRQPSFFRLSVDPIARTLVFDCDLALTPEKPTAELGLVAFEFQAKDGFRGALAAYQQLFPELNEVRQRNQGSWMAFHPISKVKGWEDFGFAIKEGTGEVKWDAAHGITTYNYSEPSTWWMSLKGTNGAPTMAECIAAAEASSNSMARAWRRCAMHGADGQRLGRIMDTPWCKGIVWNLNCAPGQGPDGEFAAKFPVTLVHTNHYVDSSEMYVTDPLDFNRANFAGMSTALVFDAKTLRPAVYKGLMAYEYVRGAWENARRRGGRTMANGTPIIWCWLAPYLDVLGTETDWHYNGKWEPHEHELMIYMRSLCGGKPFCYLQNSDFTTFTYEMSERFMQRALAYGMYPGYFSPNAADGHYFSNPKFYERDRPLFKKYMPICKRVGEAGWRPVNRLLPVDPATGVLAEQFGDRYVTLYNASTNETRSVAVPAVRELVTGATVSGSLALPPETCRVLDFRPMP